jgi:hypothetical protein
LGGELGGERGEQVADMVRAGEKGESRAGEHCRMTGRDVRQELCKTCFRCHVP